MYARNYLSTNGTRLSCNFSLPPPRHGNCMFSVMHSNRVLGVFCLETLVSCIINIDMLYVVISCNNIFNALDATCQRCEMTIVHLLLANSGLRTLWWCVDCGCTHVIERLIWTRTIHLLGFLMEIWMFGNQIHHASILFYFLAWHLCYFIHKVSY
jgi:hypothetical protein